MSAVVRHQSDTASHWPKRPLASIAEVFTDGNWVESKDQAKTGIRLVQTGNVGVGTFKDRRDKARFIDGETFDRLNCFEVLPGDVLVSRLPDPVGRACVIPSTGDKMITAVDCSIIRTDDTVINTDFLVYYTQTTEYLQAVDARCTGTTRRRISRKNLGKVAVPVPPLDEQKRIVAVLDQAFAALDRARSNSEVNLADSGLLFNTAVNDLLNGRTAVWKAGTFREIVGNIYTGPFGSLLHKSDYIDGGTPLINPSDIVDGKIEPNWSKTVSEDAANRLVAYKLRLGDLVIGRRGEMGRCASVMQDMNGWICGTGCFVIRPHDGVRSEFVGHLLRSNTLVKRLTSIATGTTMLNLNNAAVSKMPIEIPDTQTQSRIIERIEAIRGATFYAGNGYSQRLFELENLRQSLLQKAFSGELKLT